MNKDPHNKLFTMISILIGLAMSMIPASIILPTQYELIWFGIVASILIGMIIYVKHLPDEQPKLGNVS